MAVPFAGVTGIASIVLAWCSENDSSRPTKYGIGYWKATKRNVTHFGSGTKVPYNLTVDLTQNRMTEVALRIPPCSFVLVPSI